jgi:hypothetical protein
MCTRVFTSPGFEQFTGFIVDDYIVFGFIGQQHNASFGILHHFVAILYRRLPGIQYSPTLHYPVFVRSMAKYLLR